MSDNYDSPGYALAMRVLQSDLYRQLDDRERAECDELIARGQSKPRSLPAAPETAAERAEAALRWIPVTERLPEDCESVLVVEFDGGITIDCWREQYESPVSFSTQSVPVGEMWDEHEFEDITHWLPLPPAPGGER